MIGTHLGERYELTLLLQEGPIFAAYYARDKVLGRDVTVRLLKPPFATEPHFLMKLREVIKHAGSVEHVNVRKAAGTGRRRDCPVFSLRVLTGVHPGGTD